VLIFTVTFANASVAHAFAEKLAIRYNISVDDVHVLAVDGNTVVFRFSGANAAGLSAKFDATKRDELNAEYGITAVSSRPAPADSGAASDDGDDSTKLALYIAIPVVGVVIIVAAVAFVRMRLRNSDESRVNFQDYVKMADRNAKEAQGGPRGETERLL
jgi:hypothetical protein